MLSRFYTIYIFSKSCKNFLRLYKGKSEEVFYDYSVKKNASL